ncbi:MAG: hypothetical protein QNL67_03610 [Cryomorphaceae bacterium]
MTLGRKHPRFYFIVSSFIALFTQCLPEAPAYSVQSYEGTIKVTTDSAVVSTFSSLAIHRSKSYTHYMSMNGVNYEFLSNGNHLILDDTLQKEVNGFIYADGDMFIEGDSLILSLKVSQYTSDTTLYFQTQHQGTLVHVP